MSLPFILPDLPDILLEVVMISITPMTEPNTGKVHGHSIEELSYLLQSSSDIFDSAITLDSNLLGGWSNINLHGYSSGVEFVLKLPWSVERIETNPYNQQYDLAQYFSRLEIAASPLEVGRLQDSLGTPFYVVEYIKGITHSSVSDVSADEILSLKKSHQILKKEKPPGIPRYKSPNSYLDAIRSLVEEHEWLPRASAKLLELRSQYELFLPGVIASNEKIGPWLGDTMHGDLWIPNVVFRPEQNAIFLDFEACTIGDSRYDLAYLLEAHENSSLDNLSNLLGGEDVDLVNSLRPLVLACVIDWSIARLLSMESGIVEPNLSSKRIRTNMIRYISSKTERLRCLLA